MLTASSRQSVRGEEKCNIERFGRYSSLAHAHPRLCRPVQQRISGFLRQSPCQRDAAKSNWPPLAPIWIPRHTPRECSRCTPSRPALEQMVCLLGIAAFPRDLWARILHYKLLTSHIMVRRRERSRCTIRDPDRECYIGPNQSRFQPSYCISDGRLTVPLRLPVPVRQQKQQRHRPKTPVVRVLKLKSR